jgi:hypothetical protein
MDIKSKTEYDVYMRTTLTIDPVLAEQIHRRMAETKQTLKTVVNEALRVGLQAQPPETGTQPRFRVEPHACRFRAGIDQDKLNQLAGDLEAEAAAEKLGR